MPAPATYGQTLDAQLEQLKAAGCARVYRKKVTGARSGRRQLLKVLKHLAAGEVVTVTRIDCLARSTFGLFAIVKQIAGADPRPVIGGTPGRHRRQHRTVDARRAGWASRHEARLDPHAHGRGAEGRSRAKVRGQNMGRSPTLTPQQQDARGRRGGRDVER